MRIMVVEDDKRTSDYVRQGLAQAGHVVDVVEDGRDALSHGCRGIFDVIVLDRLLPGLDGLSVVKGLRASGTSTPVLFLTAVNGLDDRVEGLESGGDDYLVKPFAFPELIARVHAITRRGIRAPESEPVRLRAADLEMDLIRRSVHRGGKTIELQAQEFRLLEFLLRNVGRVVTRAMLLENVWDLNFDPRTNIVETHISRLRGKVDRGHGSELIHTVRGAGYTLRAD